MDTLTSSGYDRQLLGILRPDGWRNPEPRGPYHLVVIGGGTAGLVTAAIASSLGARTALVERGLMGGDCLNHGCVPSKALLAVAHAWHAAGRVSAAFGDGEAGPRSSDFTAIMERMRRLRAELAEHDSPGRFRELGVDVWLGEASFGGPDRVIVDGGELRFRRAVVATGTRPYLPRIPGLDTTRFLTNETIFSLTELPGRLVVIGGGSVGVELAQAFRRLGSEVTVLEEAERVLSAEDPEASAVLDATLRADGVEIVVNAVVTSVEEVPGGRRVRFEKDGAQRSVDGDEVLFACGRAPNVEGMGLERAGVRFDARAGIEVDDRLRTSNRRIFAIGDVVGPYRFTHVADAHARLVVRNALFHGRSKASELVIPWCTYTTPELAHVGAPYREIAGRGGELDTVTVPYAELDRARLEGETEGFLRVHLERGSDRIVAATLVGARAGDIIGQFSLAMRAGLGLGAMGDAVYPYPTFGEVGRKAADQWRRGKLTEFVRRVMGVYFRWR